MIQNLPKKLIIDIKAAEILKIKCALYCVSDKYFYTICYGDGALLVIKINFLLCKFRLIAVSFKIISTEA